MQFAVEDIRRRDPKGIAQALEGFPGQIRAGREAAIDLPDPPAHVRHVVGCGMGASGITSDYAGWLLSRHADRPFVTVKDYELPGFVGDHSCVVCVSYSGNTEETLACFDDAAGRGSTLAAVTTGGRLAERAQEEGAGLVTVPSGLQPRAAFGHLLVPELRVLDAWGLSGALDLEGALDETERLVAGLAGRLGPSSPVESNVAMQLALSLHGKRVRVVGARETAPVAHRLRSQFNENAKVLATEDVLPECHHNDIVAWSHVEEPEREAVVVVESPDASTPQARRVRLHKELLEARGVSVLSILAEGESELARMVTATYIGDYASLYLALLGGKDPGEVEIIEELKARLKELA